MLFALAKSDGGLLAFPSSDDAEAHCKGIDVENGAWLFYADDGSPLEARFRRSNQQGNMVGPSGIYTLQRAMSGLWLQERLAQVQSVKGCGLTALPEVIELLKINRGNRAARGI